MYIYIACILHKPPVRGRGCLESTWPAGWLEMTGLAEVNVVDLKILPQGLQSKYDKILKGEKLDEADIMEVREIQTSLRVTFGELGNQHFSLTNLLADLQKEHMNVTKKVDHLSKRRGKFRKQLNLMLEQEHLSSKLKQVVSIIEDVESKWKGDVNIGLLCCRHLLGELPARSVPPVLVPGLLGSPGPRGSP